MAISVRDDIGAPRGQPTKVPYLGDHFQRTIPSSATAVAWRAGCGKAAGAKAARAVGLTARSRSLQRLVGPHCYLVKVQSGLLNFKTEGIFQTLATQDSFDPTGARLMSRHPLAGRTKSDHPSSPF